MSRVLKVNNVTKYIGRKEIIKGISFNIEEGEILGFLGPNGAGKSTTLRMIVGLSKPSSGTIEICGASISTQYIKAMENVGCLIEGPDLYNFATGMKNLEMLSAMSKNISKEDILEVVRLVGLENRIDDKVSTYSMGMRQRLGLAQALIHKPKLLILDEPTNGFDPQGIFEFREIIKDLVRRKNISVLISSHLISEIQLMCDKVSIINDGLIIKNAKVSDLLSSGTIYWVLDDPLKGQTLLKEKYKAELKIENNELMGNIDLEKIEEMNKYLIDEGIKLKYVGIKSLTLEELFLNLTEHHHIT